VWPWLVLVGVLLVGGCSAALAVGVGWVATTVRGPADAANVYLDEARGGDTPSAACPSTPSPDPEVAASTGQNLNEVEITGGAAEVSGSLTREDGTRARITLDLDRRDGEWCVAGVSVSDR
jgi:hypothetical protein